MISIAVVFHNEQNNLSRLLHALEFVLAQEPQLEVLLIDNKSEDDSLAVAKWFQAAYPQQVTLHLREINHLADARQDALLKARFDRVAFVDADCWVPHDWIMRLQKAWVQFQDKELLAVAGANRAPYFAGNFYHALDLMQGHFLGNFGSTQACYSGAPSWVEHGSTCNLLVDRHKALSVGGFDSIFSEYAEDLDLSLRAQKQGLKIIFFPDIQVWHYHEIGYRAWFKKVFKYGKGQGLLCLLNPEILKTRRCLPLGALLVLLALVACSVFSLQTYILLSISYAVFISLLCAVICVSKKHVGLFFPVVLLMVGTQACYTLGQMVGFFKGVRVKAAKTLPATVPVK